MGLISTGVPSLDQFFGGGYPVHQVSHIFGPPAAGKTSLAFAATVATLRKGKKALWLEPRGDELGFRLRYLFEGHYDEFKYLGQFIQREPKTIEQVVEETKQFNADLTIIDGIQFLDLEYEKRTQRENGFWRTFNDFSKYPPGTVVCTWQDYHDAVPEGWPLQVLCSGVAVRVRNQQLVGHEDIGESDPIDITFEDGSCRELRRRTVWERLRAS